MSGEFALTRAFKLDGLWPETVPKGSFNISAQLPDGSIELCCGCRTTRCNRASISVQDALTLPAGR